MYASVTAITCILSSATDFPTHLVSRCSETIRALIDSGEVGIIETAAPVVGLLCRAAGRRAAEVVEHWANHALAADHKGELPDDARLSAAYVVLELVKSAAASFLDHLSAYTKWLATAASDALLTVRLSSAESLRHVLAAVRKAEADNEAAESAHASAATQQWCEDVWAVFIARLRGKATPATVHGALITITELLRNPGRNVLLDAMFSKVCSTILQYHADPSTFTRVAVLRGYVVLARYPTGAFTPFLRKIVQRLLALVGSAYVNVPDGALLRSEAFVALRGLVVALLERGLHDAIGEMVHEIADAVLDGVRAGMRGQGACASRVLPDALACLAALSQSGLMSNPQPRVAAAFGAHDTPALRDQPTEERSNLRVPLCDTSVDALSVLADTFPRVAPQVVRAVQGSIVESLSEAAGAATTDAEQIEAATTALRAVYMYPFDDDDGTFDSVVIPHVLVHLKHAAVAVRLAAVDCCKALAVPRVAAARRGRARRSTIVSVRGPQPSHDSIHEHRTPGSPTGGPASPRLSNGAGGGMSLTFSDIPKVSLDSSMVIGLESSSGDDDSDDSGESDGPFAARLRVPDGPPMVTRQASLSVARRGAPPRTVSFKIGGGQEDDKADAGGASKAKVLRGGLKARPPVSIAVPELDDAHSPAGDSDSVQSPRPSARGVRWALPSAHASLSVERAPAGDGAAARVSTDAPRAAIARIMETGSDTESGESDDSLQPFNPGVFHPGGSTEPPPAVDKKSDADGPPLTASGSFRRVSIVEPPKPAGGNEAASLAPPGARNRGPSRRASAARGFVSMAGSLYMTVVDSGSDSDGESAVKRSHPDADDFPVAKGPGPLRITALLESILETIIRDPSALVRQAAIEAVSADPSLHGALGRAACFQALFMAAGDEIQTVAAAAVGLIGTLSRKHPVVALPFLRKVLLQVMAMIAFSASSRRREQATLLLGVLFESAGDTMQQYIGAAASLLSAVGTRDSTGPVLVAALDTLGVIASAAGPASPVALSIAARYLPYLVRLAVARQSSKRRDAALGCLCRVARAVGRTADLYIEFPPLLHGLVRCLQQATTGDARRHAMRALGVLGALDPQRVPPEQDGADDDADRAGTAARAKRVLIEALEPFEKSWRQLKMPPIENELYIPVRVMSFVLRVLVDPDPAQKIYRPDAASTVMRVMRRVRPASSAAMLPLVLPAILNAARDCEIDAEDEADLLVTLACDALDLLIIVPNAAVVPETPRIVAAIGHVWPHATAVLEDTTRPPRDLVHATLVRIAVLNQLVAIAITSPWALRPYALSLMTHVLQAFSPDAILCDAPAPVRAAIRAGYANSCLRACIIVQSAAAYLCDNASSVLNAILGAIDVLRTDLTSLRIPLLQALTQVLRHCDVTSITELVIHPLLRLLSEAAIRTEVFYCICLIVAKVGPPFSILRPLVDHRISELGIQVPGTLRNTYALVGVGVKGADDDTAALGGDAVIASDVALRAFSSATKARSRSMAMLADEGGFCAALSKAVEGLYPDGLEAGLAPLVVRTIRMDQIVALRRTRGTIGADAMAMVAKQGDAEDDASSVGGSSDAEEGGGAAGSADDAKNDPTAATPAAGAAAAGADPGDGEAERYTMSRRAQARVLDAITRDVQGSADEWDGWRLRLARELIEFAPHPAVWFCTPLARSHPTLALDLLPSTFVIVWMALSMNTAPLVAEALRAKIAIASPDVKLTLLNLIEHAALLEVDIPIDVSELAVGAEQTHAAAKALRWSELDFQRAPCTRTVEAVISAIIAADQKDSAKGVLLFAYRALGVPLKEVYVYERIGDWPAAWRAFRKRDLEMQEEEDAYFENGLQQMEAEAAESGAEVDQLAALDQLELQWSELRLNLEVDKMRCLSKLSEWHELHAIASAKWFELSEGGSGMAPEIARIARDGIAPMVARSAFHTQQWSLLEDAVPSLPPDERHFMTAILRIHEDRFADAQAAIDAARDSAAVRLQATTREGYSRAYDGIILGQQLAELEEIVDFKLAAAAGDLDALDALRHRWDTRLDALAPQVQAWHSVLSIRAMAIPPQDDIDAWLRLVDMCHTTEQHHLEKKLLFKLLGVPDKGFARSTFVEEELVVHHRDYPFAVALAYFQFMFASGTASQRPEVRTRQRIRAADLLERLLQRIRDEHALPPTSLPVGYLPPPDAAVARAYASLGSWRYQLASEAGQPPELSAVGSVPILIPVGLASLARATELDPTWAAGWHHLGAALADILRLNADVAGDVVAPLAAEAVKAFFEAVVYGRDTSSVLQDVLRILTLWFEHGQYSIVRRELERGFKKAPVRVWVQVIPQIIARLNAKHPKIRDLVQRVLVAVGKAFPQTLIYPLTVHTTWNETDFLNDESTSDTLRRECAVTIVKELHGTSPRHARLIAQAKLVAHELMRTSVMWSELWFGTLTDASVSASAGDFQKTLAPIAQLVVTCSRPAQTERELGFQHKYIADIKEAWDFLCIAAQYKTEPGIATIVSRANAIMASRGSAKAASTSGDAGKSRSSVRDVLDASIHSSAAPHTSPHADATPSPVPPSGPTTLHPTAHAPDGSDAASNRRLADLSDPAWRRNLSFESAYTQAWYILTSMYKRLETELDLTLPSRSKLSLAPCSPRLAAARGLELALPRLPEDMIRADDSVDGEGELVAINAFGAVLAVMASKQRPRRMSILGDDGVDYKFLLKGHEDLRLDERVMQLFALFNTMLTTRGAASRGLLITRYPVVPLSNDTGLIGWVDGCNTVNNLINDIRDRSGVLKPLELLLLLQGLGNEEWLPKDPKEAHSMKRDLWDYATLMQKVEFLEFVLKQTAGHEITRALWVTSTSTETWLERRAIYTNSVAASSMVGYVLGLGDRHLNNLMFMMSEGRVVHIDFGDCFEVAQKRSMYPEKVPFRLTRQMANAMEVCSLEGAFRATFERLDRIVRLERDSVLALLEAFVHDPLISWRLTTPSVPEGGGLDENGQPGVLSARTAPVIVEEADGDQMGRDVLRRIESKLIGSDFPPAPELVGLLDPQEHHKMCHLDIPSHVARLIDEATSCVNLAQAYLPWSPFW